MEPNYNISVYFLWIRYLLTGSFMNGMFMGYHVDAKKIIA